ncbi:MAG: S-layer protein domain-containing protein [Methanosarcinaceae archaeon]
MKRFTAIALAALMVLTVFASVIPTSAITVDSVEVRGPVYEGTNLTTVFEANGIQDGTNSSVYYLEMNEINFAGFFYDIDEDVATENFRIYNHSGTKSLISNERTIEEDGIIYTTTIDQVNYDYDGTGEWTDQYNLMGFFAEKYVPLENDTPDKLCKLLLDTDDKHTLRTGTVLDLAGGYAITAKQVDVEGDKVWLELTKDGEFVEDEVVSLTTTTGEKDWLFDLDVADEDDVEVFRVRVTDVFQGQVDSLAVIEGIWLIDYGNVLEIDSDDEFDGMEVSDIGTDYLELKNKNSITLSKDSVKDIAEGMKFKIADSTDLRFYLMKEYTDAGTYEVRGNVVQNNGDYSWDYKKFAGFFYDLDDDMATEELEIIEMNGRGIEEKKLIYTTTIDAVGYDSDAFDGEEYQVLGLFAEKYVPIKENKADKLSKLLIDNDDKYTMRTGQSIDLAGGFSLTAQQVDVEGDKVWMELTKDGEFVEDEIIDVSGGEANWTYDRDDVQGEDDVVVFKVQITNVFQGQVDSLAVVEGMWLIDYTNIREIESNDEFGELEVDGSAGGMSIVFKNTGTITLTHDSTQDIAEGMKFKVADNDTTLRYYPFVEYTIGDTTPTNTTPTNTTPTNTTPTNTTPVNTTPVDTTPVDDTPVDTTTNDTTVNDTEDDDSIPGFASIFAITGLLAVAYLVRRN